MDKPTYSLKEVEKLFKAGAHLGHKKNRLHPKARKFVYKMEQGTSIIDLTQTAAQLEKAKKYLAEAAKENKTILVVATKKNISDFTEELCKKNQLPYITVKWLPGLLTNFSTIIKNVENLKKMYEDRENGSWNKLVKHERLKLEKQLYRLEKFYVGLLNFEKKPDLLLVVDIKREKNAVNEARQSNIPTVAIADTNANPDLVNFPIVANDDSPTSAQYLIGELIQAYVGK